MRFLPFRLLFVVLGLFGLLNCSTKPSGHEGECDVIADCQSGQVCVSSLCEQLCSNDSDCESGTICGSENYCTVGERLLPTISTVEGDSSAVCTQANGTHCIYQGMVITGTNLNGASFVLAKASGGSWELTRRSGGDDTVAAVDLPTDIVDGSDYTLTVTNAAGDVDQAIALLQGEPGPALSPNEIVDEINLATNSIDVNRLPTGTDAASVALGDHGHANYVPFGTTPVSGDIALDGTIQARSLRTSVNWRGSQSYTHGPRFPFLVTQAKDPIVTAGAPGAFDETGAISPAVIKLANGDLRMFYAGRIDTTNPDGPGGRWSGGLGFADSSDGGKTWTKYSGNPVFATGYTHCHNSVYVADTVYLYYSVYDGSDWRIHLATSNDDGLTFQAANSGLPVLDRGPSGSFDEKNVYCPAVIKDANTWHMWYHAHDGSSWNNVGHVTSPDGIVWSTHESVFPIGRAQLSMDHSVFGSGLAAIKIGEIFYLFYTLHESLPDRTNHDGGRSIYMAASDDGRWFTPYGGGPILSNPYTNDTTRWDNRNRAYMNVLLDGDALQIFYSATRIPDFEDPGCTPTPGGDTCMWQIGRAVMRF